MGVLKPVSTIYLHPSTYALIMTYTYDIPPTYLPLK